MSEPTSDDEAGDESVIVTVLDGEERHELTVSRGSTLRDVLLEAGLSPYTRYTERLNCGGRGLCATCGVRVHEGPPSDHWHDDLADRWGYPRLSCQITLDQDVTVELDDEKRVWGRRE